MIGLFAKIIHWIFTIYTFLIMIRVIGSWFPNLYYQRWMQLVCQYTDPYLNIFRRLIPPIGGRLDLSPLLAFMALQFLEKVILSLLGAFG